LTPADEYARLTRRMKLDAEEKRRIEKDTLAARDELYKARQVVNRAKEVARTARERTSRYAYTRAPRITKPVKTKKTKYVRSVRPFSVEDEDGDDWSQTKRRSPSW
jgi:hypothetical protein